MQTVLKAIESQIIASVKYFRAQFPQNYQDWKEKQNGSKQFQKNLDLIECIFTHHKFVSFRMKVLDQLLVKLLFIAKNQSFLENFESFLLQKFVTMIVKHLNELFVLKDVYLVNLSKQKEKERVEVFHRFTILIDSLLQLLKFCFIQSTKSTQYTQGKQFTNDLLKTSPSAQSNAKICQKQFVVFILQVLSSKLDEILRFKIIPAKGLYPMCFSVLRSGFLSYQGGSRVIELVGSLLNRLVFENRENIWERKHNVGKMMNIKKLEQLNQNITMILKNQNLKEKDPTKFDLTNQQKASTKQQQFSQVSKEKILFLLQQLLTKVGYQFNSQSDVQTFSDFQQISESLLQSPSKKQKLRKFVNQLMLTVERSCFQVEEMKEEQNNQQRSRLLAITQINETDEKILFMLVLLAIEFIDEESLNLQTLHPSTIITQLSSSISSHPVLSLIRYQLQQLFLSKFKLLLNKNKTISSNKTHLLRQLSKLIRFINFDSLSHDEFEQNICFQLKQLFQPNEKDLNKPLIIAVDENSRLTGKVGAQAVPLVQLNGEHSCQNYPVKIDALKESLKFQQYRHVLDEVKLFNWFQHEQTNLRLFKKMINGMNFTYRVKLLEYFITQLLSLKMQETSHFYALQMSLTKFYQLLILYFYIHSIINSTQETFQQSSLLSYRSYKQHKSIYRKYLIPKLETLYSLVVSNSEMKKLLISSKEEELLIFWNIRILHKISSFLLELQTSDSNNYKLTNQMKILHKKVVIVEYLILNLSHQTYLFKLLITSYLLQFSSEQTISQSLLPLQSTLIHRNAGSSYHNKLCNLQLIKNLLKLVSLSSRQAEQLSAIYLSRSFILNTEANNIISLLFPHLTPESMRKCLLSIRNWPLIFSHKRNIQLLNNQPLLPQQKEELFHANDSDNVTVSNALGVVVLELGEKWTVELEFSNPRKQVLINAMLNLISVNDKLIFWKRFFFQNILGKLCLILREIDNFASEGQKSSRKPQQSSNSRRHLLYQRIHTKIITLISLIPVEYYKYSTQINLQIRRNLQNLKQIIEKQHNLLKRQCFVYQRYDACLEKYKLVGAVMEKIQTGLNYKEEDQTRQEERQSRVQNMDDSSE